MITQKMKYALKALLALADEAARDQPRALTIEEIAARSGAPKRFLEHILLDVRNAGVIASMRGRSGGYRLAKNPSEVSISDLLRRIESLAAHWQQSPPRVMAKGGVSVRDHKRLASALGLTQEAVAFVSRIAAAVTRTDAEVPDGR